MTEQTKHHDSDRQRRERERMHRKTIGSDISARFQGAPPLRYLPFEPRRPDSDNRN